MNEIDSTPSRLPQEGELAHTAIRRLLMGDHPDSVVRAYAAATAKVAVFDPQRGFLPRPELGPGAGPGDEDYAVYGAWAPTVKLLCDAYLAADPAPAAPDERETGGRGTGAVKRGTRRWCWPTRRWRC